MGAAVSTEPHEKAYQERYYREHRDELSRKRALRYKRDREYRANAIKRAP